MKRKLGNWCMSLGAVLILAALSLCFWNAMENHRAAGRADTVAETLRDLENPSNDDEEPWTVPDPFDPTIKEVEIDGYLYIGTLDIPALDLSLPVMSEWDYPRLKIAPCRYSGSTKTDDLVIAAHNYDSHFGQLKNLSEGERVYFTDMDGIVSEYTISVIEILQPTAVEEMRSGEYDLTLFTCTYGGASRVTVRCDRLTNG